MNLKLHKIIWIAEKLDAVQGYQGHLDPWDLQVIFCSKTIGHGNFAEPIIPFQSLSSQIHFK